MSKFFYTSGSYHKKNPETSKQDADWKTKKILKLIDKHSLKPEKVADIGCGSGEILKKINEKVDSVESCVGYEISPFAYQQAIKHESEGLTFRNSDILQTNDSGYELILLIDVIEHIEKHKDFLKKTIPRGDKFIIHLPLDYSIINLLRPGKIKNLRDRLGHLHYFNKKSALKLLEDSGLKVEDHFYTFWGLERHPKSFLSWLIKPFRRVLSMINEDWSVYLLGGASLLVLAEKDNNFYYE